jgi:hypothetical protein
MKHLCSVFAFALIAASAASADVIVFTNEANFRAAVPITFTETFDDVPDMQVPGTVEIDDYKFVTRGIWQVPGFCSLERSIGANTIARRHITFQAPGGVRGAVKAFGLRIITFAISPPADYVAAIVTEDGHVTNVPINDVINPNPAFRGFFSSSPIQRVSIQAVGGSQFNFCMDDIMRSPINPAADSTELDIDQLDDSVSIED